MINFQAVAPGWVARPLGEREAAPVPVVGWAQREEGWNPEPVTFRCSDNEMEWVRNVLPKTDAFEVILCSTA